MTVACQQLEFLPDDLAQAIFEAAFEVEINAEVAIMVQSKVKR